MNQAIHSENKKNLILTIILIFAVVIGFLIRIKGLGKWPLTVDEYYIVKSIKSILEHGLPSFEYGGYYDRGILYQYLTSILIITGIKVELGARIIPVITNILIVHPLYLLSRKVTNKTAAVIIIFAFCFSVWEVEFARFARMYSPFQLIFVWYLYFLYKNLIEDDAKSLKWLFILSFISIFIYEASIFLSILNFLPFFWDRDDNTFSIIAIKKIRNLWGSFLTASIVFILAYFFISFDFRTMGQQNLLPEGVTTADLVDTSGKFRIPLILLSTLTSNPLWVIPCLIPAAAGLFSVLRINKNPGIILRAKLAFSFLIILAFLNLYGLVIFLLIIFMLINWIGAEDLKKAFWYVLFSIAVSFIFWSIYSLFTNSWHYYFAPKEISGIVMSLKLIWKEFTNYPYLYETYVLFRDTIFRSTILTVILLSLGIFITIFFRNGKKEEYKLLFFIFLFLLLMVSTLNLVYFKTRYFFFLYPLLLLLSFTTIDRSISKFITDQKKKIMSLVIISVLVLIISEDFNVHHLYNIDSREINYRINFSRKLKDHYYPRWDIKTPDEYVNKRVEKDDIVIINEQLNEFYLDKVDYIYKDITDNFEFPSFSILGGKKERWTGADMIYRSSDLINMLLKENKNKWLILNTVWGIRFLEADSFFVKFKMYEVFHNSDTSTIVYKIPPNPQINISR